VGLLLAVFNLLYLFGVEKMNECNHTMIQKGLVCECIECGKGPIEIISQLQDDIKKLKSFYEDPYQEANREYVDNLKKENAWLKKSLAMIRQ
jgi:hypothetical protein